MSVSDSSSLSSLPSTDDEAPPKSLIRDGTIDKYFERKKGPIPQKREPSTPPRKRPASPPHDYVLADNEYIAFIVMFRSRFAPVFAKGVPTFGPQELERGVADDIPNEQVERLLCALLGLVLNRKKDPERGHYHRALEEAVQTHAGQWPPAWNGRNPLHGGNNFHKMSDIERLTLLRTLILWSLSSSEAVSTIIKSSYKRSRQEDDLNQPLSVQSWGRDGDKRRYWLVEGQDDTNFRVYRESNIALKKVTWFSVASDIDELKLLADKLRADGNGHSKRLAEKMTNAIPRFEASEEKRKRRDYRLARKAQFSRPQPGFSLYEGRTRGKKLKYTFSDEEDEIAEALGERRTRHSHSSTPAEPSGPTYTASGRRVKSRVGGAYGESLLSGRAGQVSAEASDAGTEEPISNGRATRSGRAQALNERRRLKVVGAHIEGYNDVDEMDDESEAASSGEEWDGDDYDDMDQNGDEEGSEDENMTDDENDLDGKPSHLMVSLRYRKSSAAASKKDNQSNLTAEDSKISQDMNGLVNGNGGSEDGTRMEINKIDERIPAHRENHGFPFANQLDSTIVVQPAGRPQKVFQPSPVSPA
ncbi:MAG: hypothetical protein M1834_006170 [Cirrosporium novae-zelandiae]|nr:MAG: hypothetical protein M1834_006170 [Cirrosporium novae-zelandiae]